MSPVGHLPFIHLRSAFVFIWPLCLIWLDIENLVFTWLVKNKNRCLINVKKQKCISSWKILFWPTSNICKIGSKQKRNTSFLLELVRKCHCVLIKILVQAPLIAVYSVKDEIAWNSFPQLQYISFSSSLASSPTHLLQFNTLPLLPPSRSILICPNQNFPIKNIYKLGSTYMFDNLIGVCSNRYCNIYKNPSSVRFFAAFDHDLEFPFTLASRDKRSRSKKKDIQHAWENAMS